MSTNDRDHPWFRPLWRRVGVVAICAAIALWDLWSGRYGWALVFGGLGGYAVYVFFIAWDKDAADGEDTDPRP